MKRLSDEQKVIRLAVALGAKWLIYGNGYSWLCAPSDSQRFTDVRVIDAPLDHKKVVLSQHIPDWQNDFNALHEVEKTLTREQHRLFRRTLFTLVTGIHPSDMTKLKKPLRESFYHEAAIAPCHTRFEAIGIVFGLWEAGQ